MKGFLKLTLAATGKTVYVNARYIVEIRPAVEGGTLMLIHYGDKVSSRIFAESIEDVALALSLSNVWV